MKYITFLISRRSRLWVVTFFLFFNIHLTYSQVVSGKILDQEGNPKEAIELVLEGTNFIAFTNGTGAFRFFNIPAGSYVLTSKNDAIILSVPFTISGENLNLKTITASVRKNSTDANDISVIAIDDLEQIQEEESSAVSSMLTASQDPYQRAVAYNLSNLRYRARGYNNEDVEQYLNGMPVNDLDDGRVFWNNWGGLNDVLRNQINVNNLRAADFTFGGLGGANFIDLRASNQRVQKKLVYTLSNRSYRHRMMYTHSTGMMDNGWAFTFSGSKRWAQEGYVEGTHYDAYSYFMSVDRKIGKGQTLNFVFLGAPLRRGRTNPSTQEAYDLSGSNFYNPNWGFQGGVKRSAREDRVHQPIAILRYDLDLGDRTKIMASLGYEFGKYGTTRLEWYQSPDPRPDYYRKLPSFQTSSDLRQQVADYWSSDETHRQLNWDKMYEANYGRVQTIENANGVPGSNLTGRFAAYFLEEQRFDNNKLNFNATVTHEISDNLTFNGGIKYLNETSHNFKVLDDLLGAEFTVDWDEFAVRDFPNNNNIKQADLNRPNRIIREGDRFGWDFDIVTQNVGGFGQLQYEGKRFDLFASGLAENVQFYREGFTRTGTFPENSFGKSDVKDFWNLGTKAGATFKANARNYIYGVLGYRQRAPFSRFAFISQRTRNDIVNNLTTEKILNGEVGYIFKYTGINGRISGFYTDFKDQTDNSSFYFDDANTFVNYIMTGINKRHSGVEAGVEVKLPFGFSVEGAGGISQNIFTSRPLATISQDNSAKLLAVDRVVYQKNFYVPGAPQKGASLTLGYRAKNFWFVNINAAYVSDLYLDFNPDRRTNFGVEPLTKEENPELWNSILAQEKAPAALTFNVFGGKSWKVNDYYIAVNASVGNALDDKNIITGGFEQLRFDYETKDVNRFPPRYFYGYGRNYSINVNFSF